MRVHFLSHYYVEPADSAPLMVAGLGIPDLVPGFARIHNSVLRRAPEPVAADLKEIQRGIDRHYAGDKWFHASAGFAAQVSLFCQAFVAAGLDRRRWRLSVMAHLAAEMMIDRQIVVQRREVCEAFYEKLMAADEAALGRWFEGLGLGEQLAVYRTRLGFFKERKFLFLFEEIERVAFGLGRVYAMATGTEMTDGEKEKFISALHNMDAQMRYSWQGLLKP